MDEFHLLGLTIMKTDGPGQRVEVVLVKRLLLYLRNAVRRGF